MARCLGFLVRAVLLTALLASALLPDLATAQYSTDDLCYSVSWDLNTVKQTKVVRPVTKFPVGHALVNITRCGQTFQAGQPLLCLSLSRFPVLPVKFARLLTLAKPLPSSQRQGNTFPTFFNVSSNPIHPAPAGTCQPVRGGAGFYSYEFPNAKSSNTGFEQDDTDLVYFVRDQSGNVSFVLVHDKAYSVDNTAVNRVRMRMDSPDLKGKKVSLHCVGVVFASRRQRERERERERERGEKTERSTETFSSRKRGLSRLAILVRTGGHVLER
jgi:hypothetical protein